MRISKVDQTLTTKTTNKNINKPQETTVSETQKPIDESKSSQAIKNNFLSGISFKGYTTSHYERVYGTSGSIYEPPIESGFDSEIMKKEYSKHQDMHGSVRVYHFDPDENYDETQLNYHSVATRYVKPEKLTYESIKNNLNSPYSSLSNKKMLKYLTALETSLQKKYDEAKYFNGINEDAYRSAENKRNDLLNKMQNEPYNTETIDSYKNAVLTLQENEKKYVNGKNYENGYRIKLETAVEEKEVNQQLEDLLDRFKSCNTDAFRNTTNIQDKIDYLSQATKTKWSDKPENVAKDKEIKNYEALETKYSDLETALKTTKDADEKDEIRLEMKHIKNIQSKDTEKIQKLRSQLEAAKDEYETCIEKIKQLTKERNEMASSGEYDKMLNKKRQVLREIENLYSEYPEFLT